MKYLLDTCVISELVAKQPERQVINWLDQIDDDRVYLSVITVGEIKRGIEKLPESMRKKQLDEWLADDLMVRFMGRILLVDLPVMMRWGVLVAELEAIGRKLPAIDSLIAAIALNGKLQLVTRNEKDFADSGVSVINPWKIA
ncbi:MAG: type II toxin-antitoxin system VapC family toxin [Chloroflexi bacterium]|nr:type II toxin-antitoxin system VapC family toxin [Chloroflexota bacterium]